MVVYRVLTNGGSSLQHLGGGHGPHGERDSKPITGVWGQSPQRGPGAKPLVRGSAKVLLVFRRF